MDFEKNQICDAERPVDNQFIELAEYELAFIAGGSGDVVVC